MHTHPRPPIVLWAAESSTGARRFAEAPPGLRNIPTAPEPQPKTAAARGVSNPGAAPVDDLEEDTDTGAAVPTGELRSADVNTIVDETLTVGSVEADFEDMEGMIDIDAVVDGDWGIVAAGFDIDE